MAPGRGAAGQSSPRVARPRHVPEARVSLQSEEAAHLGLLPGVAFLLRSLCPIRFYKDIFSMYKKKKKIKFKNVPKPIGLVQWIEPRPVA